jgi:hypothetical protein
LYPLAQHVAPIEGKHVLCVYMFGLVPLGISTTHWALYRRIPGESLHVVYKALCVLGISIVIPIAAFVSYVATFR